MVENSKHSYPIVLYPPTISSILNSYPPIDEVFDDLPLPPVITYRKFIVFLVVSLIIAVLFSPTDNFVDILNFILFFVFCYIGYVVLGIVVILLFFDLFDSFSSFFIWLNDAFCNQTKNEPLSNILLKHLVFIFPYTPLLLLIELLIENPYKSPSPYKEYKIKYDKYKEEYHKIIDLYEKRKQYMEPIKSIEDMGIWGYREKLIKIWEYRKKLIKEFLQSVEEPKNITTNPKKGYLENYFRSYLEFFWDDNLILDLQLKKPNFDYPYTPDFIYQNQDWNLYIDIEIDEPYVKNTKTPIHVDDSTRNQFFLESRWIIIRFAEEQIYCYPYRCCKHIGEVISTITGEPLPNSLLKVSDLEAVPRWDYAEAQKMAEQDYRESYLNEL